MDIFVGLGGKQVSCALLVPDIENALLSCQNIVILSLIHISLVKRMKTFLKKAVLSASLRYRG